MNQIISLKTHVKVLGYIYAGLACFVGLLAILILIIYAGQGEIFRAGRVVPILLVLALWWLWIGDGLLHYHRAVRFYAIIVAGVLMIGLNGLLFFRRWCAFFFQHRMDWIIFHFTCILIGIYTVVVMLLPGISDVLH